jgi:hypothetical protein
MSGILLRLGCHARGVARVSAQRGGAFVTKLASSASVLTICSALAAPGLSCSRCCVRVGPEGRGFGTKLASSASVLTICSALAAPGLSRARCCARVGPEGRGFCDQAGLLGFRFNNLQCALAAPGLSRARCCARVGPEGRGFCDQAGLLVSHRLEFEI